MKRSTLPPMVDKYVFVPGQLADMGDEGTVVSSYISPGNILLLYILLSDQTQAEEGICK